MAAYFKNYKVYKLGTLYSTGAPGHVIQFCEK